MDHRPLLYLITPPQIEDVSAFQADFARALAGGPVASLQIRCKTGNVIDAEMTRRVAEAVQPLAADHQTAIIINDSVSIAAELGADGVHLGQGDGDVSAARQRLGSTAVIGVTCHNSRHLAMLAGEAGADYVAFGAFYPTATKTPKFTAEPDILTWWQTLMELPCVAIGGIMVENGAPLIAAGADFLAVSSGVWDHPQGPEAAVCAFNEMIDGFGPFTVASA